MTLWCVCVVHHRWDGLLLMHKCEHDGMGTLATSAIVFGVIRDLFHGAQIANGLYKVEVFGLMLLDAPFHFLNLKNDPLQLLLKQAWGQFTLWDNAMMQKIN